MHDERQRRWRHLDFGAVRVQLRATIAQVWCPRCRRVRTEQVPWARPGARFTRDFEDVIGWLAQRMDKTSVARLMRTSWVSVDQAIRRVVADHLDQERLDGLYRLGIDEISYRKGHHYLTVVADHDTGNVVWVARGRSQASLGEFFDAIGPQRLSQVEAVTMDGSRGFIGAVGQAILNRPDLPGPVPRDRVGHPGPGRGVPSRADAVPDRRTESGQEPQTLGPSPRRTAPRPGEADRRAPGDPAHHPPRTPRPAPRLDPQEELRDLFRIIAPEHAADYLTRWIRQALPTASAPSPGSPTASSTTTNASSTPSSSACPTPASKASTPRSGSSNATATDTTTPTTSPPASTCAAPASASPYPHKVRSRTPVRTFSQAIPQRVPLRQLAIRGPRRLARPPIGPTAPAEPGLVRSAPCRATCWTTISTARLHLALMSRLLDPMHRRYIEALGIGPDARTLEVGFGNDSVSSVARRGGRPSRTRRSCSASTSIYCRPRRAGNLDYLQADIVAGPVDPGTFDLVTARTVLHHVTDVDAAMRNLVTSLAPGGAILLIELRTSFRSASPNRQRCRRFWESWLQWSRERGIDYFLGRTLARRLAALGIDPTASTAPRKRPSTRRFAVGHLLGGHGDRALRSGLVESAALDGRTVDQFLIRCADPTWWTQTIAFTAVHGRSATPAS